MKFVELADMGAYFQLLTPGIPELGGWVYMGPYTPEAYWYEFTGIMTNATPTDAYRGAGRPEATYVVERLVDAFARQDRQGSCRGPPDEPASAVRRGDPVDHGAELDSGDFEPAFDRALEMADYTQIRKEQAARRDAGDVRQIGIGLSSYIEMCGLAPSNILGALRYVAGGWDAAEIECRPYGKVVVRTGTSPHGQGQATSWSQIVADGLGVSPDDVEVLHGDTAVSAGHGHVRVTVGLGRRRGAPPRRGAGTREGAHDRRARARGGRGRPRVERRSLPGEGRAGQGAHDPRARRVAWNAHALPDGVEPMLEGTAVFDPPNFTWPAGTHVCVVEVDTETGKTDILRYVASTTVAT